MLTVIEAEGNPRDMGEAQGRLLASQIRSHMREVEEARRRSWLPSLRGFTSGRLRGGGPGREVIRHYTHLSERMDGLARGAGVSMDAILACHLDGVPVERSTQSGERPVAAVSAMGLSGDEGVTLARSLSDGTLARGPIFIRQSRPAVGFSSVEVVLPWLCASLAGINSAGLTACIVPEDRQADAEEGLAEAPSPVLLVQESLQRFESVEAALDWAMNRPAWGHATLLLADAEGDRVSIHFRGAKRSDRRFLDEALVIGPAGAEADQLNELVSERGSRDQLTSETGGLLPDWVRLIPSRRSFECRRGPASFRIEI